jgi:hypothetical protein
MSPTRVLKGGGGIYLTDRPSEDRKTANSESYAWVRPSAKIIDDGPPDIFVCTAFGEDTEGYNRNEEETDMDNESRGLHCS